MAAYEQLEKNRIGLRERKKQRTRQSVVDSATRLFAEQGYDETTLAEIAEAAEISPSTFFNYFRTKEDVVFEDDLDPLILAAFDALPGEVNPIGRLRAAMREVFSKLTPDQDLLMRQRTRLLVSTPELRGAMLSQFADLVDQIAELLASRVNRPADDFAMQNMAGAVLGVLMSAVNVIARDPEANMVELADAALAHLEAGLPLDWKR